MATTNFAAHRARLFKPGSGSQAAIAYDPADMYVEFDDFSGFDAVEGYTATQLSAGTCDVLGSLGAGGILEIDCNSTTQGQGMNIQRNLVTFLPAAGKDIFFEARFKVKDNISACQVFAGLSVIDTTIIASNAQSSANHIGIQCIDDAQGDVTLSTKDGSTTATAADVFRLEEDTYLTAGFVVVGTSSIQAIRNGISVGDEITTNIPTTGMAVSFVCQSGGSSKDPILELDWFICAQLR
jgi:hypothetical protein